MKKLAIIISFLTFVTAQTRESIPQDSIPKIFQKGSKSVQYGIGELLVPGRFGGLSFSKKEFISPLKAKRTGISFGLRFYDLKEKEELNRRGQSELSPFVTYSLNRLSYVPIDESLYLYKGKGYSFTFSGSSRSSSDSDGRVQEKSSYSLGVGYRWIFGFEYQYKKNIGIHLENNFGLFGSIKNEKHTYSNGDEYERRGPFFSHINSVKFGISFYYYYSGTG